MRVVHTATGPMIKSIPLLTTLQKLLTLSVLLLTRASYGEPLPSYKNALEQIPEEDRQYLSTFFKGMLTDGSFGATLFGQKASSSFEFPYWLGVRRFYHQGSAREFLREKGWKIWLQYQSLFTIKNFLFFYFENELSINILFVHKDKMSSVLKQNQDFFFTTFSKSITTPEEAVLYWNSCIEAPNRHVITGLLLGYDWDSCNAFEERNSLTKEASPPLPLDQELYTVDEHSKERELSLKRIWPPNPFFCAQPPGYLAFDILPDPQTDIVQQKILHLYESECFLDEFLDLLTK